MMRSLLLTPGPERKEKRSLYRHVDIYAKEPKVDELLYSTSFQLMGCGLR